MMKTQCVNLLSKQTNVSLNLKLYCLNPRKLIDLIKYGKV